MHVLLGHLTNYSLNKNSSNYVHTDSLDQQDEINGSKKTVTALFKLLQEQGIDTEHIYANIKDAIMKTLTAMAPFVRQAQRQELGCEMQQAKGDCFAVMGFDLLIDQDLKAWVLEVNNSPSMNINLCKEGKTLIKEPSEIDRYIKTKIVGDAIKLMRYKKSKARKELGEYRTWQQVLPSEAAE